MFMCQMTHVYSLNAYTDNHKANDENEPYA